MIKIVLTVSAMVAICQAGIYGPVVAAPIVAHHPVAVSHSASVVHHVRPVHVVHPAPIVHAAPLINPAPLYHAPVVPVIKHAPLIAVHHG